MLYRANFKHQVFRRFVKKNNSFHENSIHEKGKKSDQLLKLIVNSLFGDTIGKDFDYKHEFKIECWKETQNDDEVEEYHKLQIEDYVVKL